LLRENDKIFVHDLLQPKVIDQVTGDGYRYYTTPEGNKYPSITSALSYLSEKHIDAWKERIGEEEANRIGNRAAKNGTALHEMAEKYVLNDPTWRDAFPITVKRFLPLKALLDQHIDCVYGTELRLYSDELRIAGTADLIVKCNGELTIADFKTSMRPKTDDQILAYYMQATTYAICLRELYGLNITQIMIFMAVNEDKPILFTKKVADYENLTRNYLKHYHAGRLKHVKEKRSPGDS